MLALILAPTVARRPLHRVRTVPILACPPVIRTAFHALIPPPATVTPPGQGRVGTVAPAHRHLTMRIALPRRKLLPGTAWAATSSRIAERMQQTRLPPTRTRPPTPGRLATAPATHMAPARPMPTLSRGTTPSSARTPTRRRRTTPPTARPTMPLIRHATATKPKPTNPALMHPKSYPTTRSPKTLEANPPGLLRPPPKTLKQSTTTPRSSTTTTRPTAQPRPPQMHSKSRPTTT